MAVYTKKCKICNMATPVDKVANKLAICPNCGASYVFKGRWGSSDHYFRSIY